MMVTISGERCWEAEQHWSAEPDAGSSRGDGIPQECKSLIPWGWNSGGVHFSFFVWNIPGVGSSTEIDQMSVSEGVHSGRFSARTAIIYDGVIWNWTNGDSFNLTQLIAVWWDNSQFFGCNNDPGDMTIWHEAGGGSCNTVEALPTPPPTTWPQARWSVCK